MTTPMSVWQYKTFINQVPVRIILRSSDQNSWVLTTWPPPRPKKQNIFCCTCH